MALIYLLSGLLLGVAVTRRIRFTLYPFEAAAIAVTLGLVLWVWLAFLASLVMPYDLGLPIVVTACAAASIALWPGGRTPQWRPLEGGRGAWIVWGVASAATTGLLARMFWTHSLVRDEQGLWTAGPSWADYGVHAALINHIASATSLPSDLPIAAGEKLTYPFLVDLLSAFYVQGGMSLHDALFWPGVLLAIAICQLLISTGLRLFERISVGVGGLVLALTIGSAAGAWTAWSDWRESGKGLFAFLGELPMDYSQVGEAHANITNLVADALLPQRAILAGLAVGLIALTFLVVARKEDNTRLIWPAALLIGLMPMTHAHTFIVGMAWLAALAAEAAWRTRTVPKAHLWPIGGALLLAAPQLLWQQLANGNGTGGRFRLWWMWEEGQSLPGFYWANFGLFGVALIATAIWMRRDRRALWLWPMLLILLVSQIYAFQPFEYDNTKLITWTYIVGGFYIAYLASELVRRHRAWLALVVPVAILIVTPGSLSILHETQLRYQFATPDDLALADWVRKNTKPDAVFATTDRPNNPVSALAGRPIIMGYRGWLFSYNIPYDQREATIKAALAGRFNDPLLDKYDAKYLLVGASEDPSAWPIDEAALQTVPPPVFTNDAWRVYQLR